MASAARSFSSQVRSSERATKRFSGSLGLVAGAFAPKGPLFVKLARLLVELPKRRNRHGDLVGREGLQKNALDQRVDG